jgi:hypothetical protein
VSDSEEGELVTGSADASPPRYYANAVNLAPGAFDVALTFIEADMTALPEGTGEPSKATVKSVAQVTMSLGATKALIPLLVKMVAEYEGRFGEIPSPGFDSNSKG